MSNTEVGENGFDIDEAVALLHSIRGLNIFGGNIVCMMRRKTALVKSLL